MKNKKIALLSLYWLPHKGGPAIYVYNLASELKVKNCYDVFVITPYPDPTPNDSLMVIKGSGVWLIMTTFLALWRIKPNIIHCHVNIYMLMGAMFFRFFHTVRKIIFTFHTQPVKNTYFSDNQSKMSWLTRILKKLLFNLVYNNCDCITSVSKVLIANIKEVYGLSIKRDLEIITPGAKPHQIKREILEAFKSNNDLTKSFPVFCTIGVFYWDWKVAGIIFLLEAFAGIVEKHPAAKLIIVGDGRFRNQLEEKTKELSIEHKVIFTGYMDDPYIALKICDIYCHLGLNEGVSLAVIEAMSCGKPIIAARSGGLPEVIIDGKTGILVDPNRRDAYNAMMSLLEDSTLRKTLAMNARDTARKEYRWECIVEKFVEIYETVNQHN